MITIYRCVRFSRFWSPKTAITNCHNHCFAGKFRSMHARAARRCLARATRLAELPTNPKTLIQSVHTEASTHFGFQTVREADKEGMVKQVFRDVAERCVACHICRDEHSSKRLDIPFQL